MLSINCDAITWKKDVYNKKGCQFVYFIRISGSNHAHFGIHKGGLSALRKQYKTYYSSFNAYIFRVADSKKVAKTLMDKFQTHHMIIKDGLVYNKSDVRDLFKYIGNKYDMDRRGKSTINYRTPRKMVYQAIPVEDYKHQTRQLPVQQQEKDHVSSSFCCIM